MNSFLQQEGFFATEPQELESAEHQLRKDLAQCYENGNGCKKDAEKAKEIYKEIVECGECNTEEALADLNRLAPDMDVGSAERSRERARDDVGEEMINKRTK